jgi:hypothetical protein
VSARFGDRVRRFAALAPEERGIALRALVLLTIVPVLVRARGLPRLLRAGPARRGAMAPARTRRIVRSVAASLPWTPSCLSEALTAARLIAGTGGSCQFVLGVAAPDRPFEAHAWLELDGVAEPVLTDRWRELSRWAVGPRHS